MNYDNTMSGEEIQRKMTIRRAEMDGKTKQLLTVFEAETLTGRKASTWRRDILLRKIPCVRIGRQVRIPIEAIEQLVREGYCPALGDRV